jgi:hypothetical protein
MAADRRCPGQDTLSVREAFATEAPRLLALPDNNAGHVGGSGIAATYAHVAMIIQGPRKRMS